MVLDGDVVVHTNWRNISEKKDLELKLAEQKEIFETLFNESMDGLSIFDGHQYIDCNKAFLTLFGFTHKDQVMGLHPIDLSPEFQPDGKTSRDSVRVVLQDSLGRGSTRFEWVHQKVDGTKFWAEVILTMVKLNGVFSIYAAIRDISEKKQLELELYERNAELDRTNQDLEQMLDHLKQTQDQLVESEKMASLGSLVAGVAHEINTPVGVGLMGITHLMEENETIRKRYQNGELSEEVFEDYLSSTTDLSKIVLKNLDRTAHLVRGFKQIAVDQASEEERAINLKEYIEEIIFSLGSVIRKANANIEVDCPPDYHVITNPGHLSQVVTNLIVNSITHGFQDKKGGKININIREKSAKQFTMIYKDDGKGISKSNLTKIFDPFFTTNRANGGSGLGLNVTYNIVKNTFHGSITCRSQENEGVEFTLNLKVKERM